MLQITSEKDKVTAKIDGELDHHFSALIREEIDSVLEHSLPKILELDFSGVTFMDSSGIGLIMGRYKIVRSMNGKIVIKNANSNITKLLRMAGISHLAEIQEGDE